MQRICVFCGSSPGATPVYMEQARLLGQTLARRAITLVYGGASIGTMGAVADAALDAGGEVIGVIPRALQELEIAHTRLTHLHVVASMHERKALMAELSEGFIALPGGAGTLEEIFEVWTWAQLGMHRKPCGLLNVAHYYDALLTFLDHMVDQRFVRIENRAMLMVAADPDTLLNQFATYQPPNVPKWIDSKTT